MVKQKEVVVRFRGGGSIIAIPPAFSDDSSRIYVAWKNVVLSYNPKTAMRISEYNGLTHNLVGFGCTYLRNQEVVVACTVYGAVQVWEVNTGVSVAKFKCKLHVCYFKLLSNDDGAVPKAFLAVNNGEHYNFALMNLETGKLQMQKLILKAKTTAYFDACQNGKYYVVVQGSKLYYNRFGTERFCKYSISNRKFTCVACHPDLECVITGDNTGRVLLWHSLRHKPVQAVFHWHTNPTQSLAFSVDGTYFYSGGSECVLVKWNMDDNIYKQFLPRLPSIINQISVAKDNTLIAIATADNAIQIVDSRFNYVNVIQHLVLGNDYSAGIIYDPRSKALLLNGIVGHVQFYYPKDMSLLCNLDVTCQNKFTDEREIKIMNTMITKVALDKTGYWLTTVESRDDPEFPELRLKFWAFDSAKQNFSLNTCVEEPHNDVITDVVYQPMYDKDDVMCITAGRDKKFKIWKVMHVSTVHYEGQSWQCLNVVCYRDLTPNAVAFATDGSLLAVAFSSIVTTWLPNSCELKCSLQHPSCQDDLIHVSFGVGPQCHLLVSATSELINVWNLLTLSLSWMVPVNVSFIISDPLTSFKAVFTNDKKVYIFEPKSSNLIYSEEKCLENVGIVKAATFIPRLYNSDVNVTWYQRSQIYLVDSNQEMYSIEKNEKIIDTETIYYENAGHSLFSYMLPKVRSGMNSNLKVTHLYTKDDKSDKINQLLQTPAHTMPPLHVTCENILQSMIIENRKAESESNSNQEEDLNSAKRISKTKALELIDESLLANLSELNLKSTSWMSIF